VAERIFDGDARCGRSVPERHLDSVRTRALCRIGIIPRVTLVLHDHRFLAQGVDAGIVRGDLVVIRRFDVALQQSGCHDVLHAMVAFGGGRQRPTRGVELERRAMCPDPDLADVVDPVPDERMQPDRALGRRLRVEYRGKGDLELNVLDDRAAERLRYFQSLAPEKHIVQAPRFRGERGGIAHLSADREEREEHAARCGIRARP
jgi:hypothetical protein